VIKCKVANHWGGESTVEVFKLEHDAECVACSSVVMRGTSEAAVYEKCGRQWGVAKVWH